LASSSELPSNSAVDLSNKITAALMKLLEQFLAILGESYAPVLALPFVKFFFEYTINYLGEKLSVVLQQDEALLIISFQSAQDKAHYQTALENLRKGDDPDALKKARDAASAIINWPGVH
jgi:hypothetical protein